MGDTTKVALTVSVKGTRIAVAWHAPHGYRFCRLVLTQGRGQIFQSTNPSATYAYRDVTSAHNDGIRTLTATSRNAG